MNNLASSFQKKLKLPEYVSSDISGPSILIIENANQICQDMYLTAPFCIASDQFFNGSWTHMIDNYKIFQMPLKMNHST